MSTIHPPHHPMPVPENKSSKAHGFDCGNGGLIRLDSGGSMFLTWEELVDVARVLGELAIRSPDDVIPLDIRLVLKGYLVAHG